MQDYIVLRDLSRARTAEPFATGALRMRTLGGAAQPTPKIETEKLNPNEVSLLARDPEVRVIARKMPTKLIEPIQLQPTAAAAAWGVEAVGALNSPFTGAGVVVAVLDTGIDKTHAAFSGVSIVEKDFSGSGNGDAEGHGTHCAGTIFGRDVGGKRIGVARGVDKALIGKVLDNNGAGDSEMIFNGIQWAVQNGARVISMSLGFDFPGLVQRLINQNWPAPLATSVALEAYRGNLRMFDALMEMVEARAAFDEGVVVVAAAGNESERTVNADYEIAASLPAAAEGVISVAALGQDGQKLVVADFSNTFVQVSAPGVAILSADAASQNGLRGMSGTSMACPHVAGVAALWWEALRNSPTPASARGVAAKLIASARTAPLKQGVDPADRGYGIVTAPTSAIA